MKWDARNKHAANLPGFFDERYRRVLYGVLAGLTLLLSLALPAASQAAEPIELVISGIEGDALDNVRAALVLPVGLLQGDRVDRLWLDRFARQAVESARTALEPFGYYNAVVTVTVEALAERFRLLVTVTPGAALRLARVSVSLAGAGDQEKRLQRLKTAFPLKAGDVLLHAKYEEAKSALAARARDLGYLDAEYSRHEIRIAQPGTSATIELLLETGPRYYFGATSIQGAPDYPDSFLRRHLTYAADETFSYPQLGESQRNFSNSERFSEVVMTPDLQAASAFRVPVTVQLKQAPRFSLRPGIGYGTDTGARFTVRYRDLNVFHLGHELSSNLYIAERLQGLVTGYSIPSPRDVRSSTTLQLNLQQEETSNYHSRILALELARNRSFGPGKLGTAAIKAHYEEYTVAAERSRVRLLLPDLRFSDDRYSNPVRPRRGFRYTLELRGTHQLLGSDTALVQMLAGGSHLLPLPGRFALHTRANAAVTLLNDPLSDIPPSLRFFAGGDQSVRGYSYKSLGPRNAAGNVTGGKQLLTGSAELERALFQKWGISVFYDVGNSFNSFSAVSLFQGAGVGLHYYTSVGALNLSIAWPLGGSYDPSPRIHFTVGFEL